MYFLLFPFLATYSTSCRDDDIFVFQKGNNSGLFLAYDCFTILYTFVFLSCISDIDGDSKLTEEEFSDPDTNQVPEDMTPNEYRQERIQEFKAIDEDENGHLDRRELLVKCNEEFCSYGEHPSVCVMTVYLCNYSMYMVILYCIQYNLYDGIL